MNKINKELSKLGKIELVKGNGYFYFIGDDVDIDISGVYVNSLNQLTLKQWIEEAKERLL